MAEERSWRDWFRFIERAVVFLGALALVIILFISVFGGGPGHDELQEQLDRIEARVDQLE